MQTTARRKGRKRKAGYRSPSGRRHQPDPRLVVLAQPHRRGLPGNQSGDQRLENRLGQLHFIGAISASEYAAGKWYAGVVARWRAVMSAPDPTRQPQPGRGGEIPNDEAERRVAEYTKARRALAGAGAMAVSITDDLILRDQPLPEHGFRSLMAGLRALDKYRGEACQAQLRSTPARRS